MKYRIAIIHRRTGMIVAYHHDLFDDFHKAEKIAASLRRGPFSALVLEA